jgi:hypothetical protein
MVLVMFILYNCCTMHNNTHSVHNRLLKLWQVRLLPQWPCCYVPSPPLSGANCRPFPHSGGPGPPVSKMAPFSPGFTHTPSPLSATGRYWHSLNNLLHSVTQLSIRSDKFPPRVLAIFENDRYFVTGGFLVLMKVETVFCSLEVVTYSEPETRKP